LTSQIDSFGCLQDAAQVEPLSPRCSDPYLRPIWQAGWLMDAFQIRPGGARDLSSFDPETLTWFAEQGLKLLEQPGTGQLPIREEVIQTLETAPN